MNTAALIEALRAIDRLPATIAKYEAALRDAAPEAEPVAWLNGSEWAAQRREALKRNVAYHVKNHAEEVARAESRTAWVQALRASLPEK